jgi:hypothetical protein
MNENLNFNNAKPANLELAIKRLQSAADVWLSIDLHKDLAEVIQAARRASREQMPSANRPTMIAGRSLR